MYEKVPQELKNIQHWVCFRQDKAPLNPRTGSGAMSNNSDTWSGFSEAVDAVPRLGAAGIGFMLGDGIFGVDLDHCIDIETGEVSERAQDVLNTVLSYAEISPSGAGIHILCRGELPPGGRRIKGLEMYDRLRYFTVTGNTFGEPLPLADCTASAAIIHEKYLTKAEEPRKPAVKPEPIALTDKEVLDAASRSREGGRFDDLFNGRWQTYYASQSEADLAFCNMLAFWFGADLERMDQVFRLSGMMRPKWDEHRGEKTYAQITLGKAIGDCQEVYAPPAEIPGLAGSVSELAGSPIPSEAKPGVKKYSLDDTGNAERFKDFCGGNIRYSHTDDRWLIWDGCRWRRDETDEIKRLADQMLDGMNKECFGIQNPEVLKEVRAHIRRSRSSKGKTAFLKEAQHLDGIPITTDAMDRHKGVLNVKNGVMNLRTGELVKHKKSLYLTRVAPIDYEPNTKCPVWDKFLEDITGGDVQLIDYLQTLAGYCLTGSIREQCVFFLYGTGSNGKSTFTGVLRDILGDYAMMTQAETVMLQSRSSGGARGDLARLKGARMVTTSEPDDGMRLHEGLIKQMTGGESITARFLYGNDFEYVPEFKIIVATNYKPHINGTDYGIWRRIRLIPFEMNLPEEKQDKLLPEKLRRELPGILAWCVRGAVAWQQRAAGGRTGFPKCKAVDSAVEEYKGEMDRLRDFLEICIKAEEGCSIQAATLYKMYQRWCGEAGEKFPMSRQKFGKEMKRRFDHKDTRVWTEYLNITPAPEGFCFLSDEESRALPPKREVRYEQIGFSIS